MYTWGLMAQVRSDHRQVHRYTGTRVPSYPFTFSEQCLSGLFLLRGDIGYLDELVINRGSHSVKCLGRTDGGEPKRTLEPWKIIKALSSNGWGYA
jgi:hypothetical protein